MVTRAVPNKARDDPFEVIRPSSRQGRLPLARKLFDAR
jgi:hypothetical protein